MNCAIDTTQVQQDDGTVRSVEIIPNGCLPTTDSACKSGYMAPAENVSFPENSLQQCCKCKMGEECPLCVDPLACTDEEKEQFITEDNSCFTEITPSAGPSAGPSTGPSAGPSSDSTKDEEDNSNMLFIGGTLIFVVILIIIFISVSSRPKTI